jgi:hypothetical protein
VSLRCFFAWSGVGKILIVGIDILSMLEMATAVAAVSVPGLKPLLDRRAGSRGVTEYSGEMKA